MDRSVPFDEIVGIFDLDSTTVSKTTRDFLARAEKAGIVENVLRDPPKSFMKSFVLCNKKGIGDKVYIAQISPSALLRRASFIDGLNNL